MKLVLGTLLLMISMSSFATQNEPPECIRANGCPPLNQVCDTDGVCHLNTLEASGIANDFLVQGTGGVLFVTHPNGCKKIQNDNAQNVFIPLNTNEEWTNNSAANFPNVTLEDCPVGCAVGQNEFGTEEECTAAATGCSMVSVGIWCGTLTECADGETSFDSMALCTADGAVGCYELAGGPKACGDAPVATPGDNCLAGEVYYASGVVQDCINTGLHGNCYDRGGELCGSANPCPDPYSVHSLAGNDSDWSACHQSHSLCITFNGRYCGNNNPPPACTGALADYVAYPNQAACLQGSSSCAADSFGQWCGSHCLPGETAYGAPTNFTVTAANTCAQNHSSCIERGGQVCGSGAAGTCTDIYAGWTWFPDSASCLQSSIDCTARDGGYCGDSAKAGGTGFQWALKSYGCVDSPDIFGSTGDMNQMLGHPCPFEDAIMHPGNACGGFDDSVCTGTGVPDARCYMILRCAPN